VDLRERINSYIQKIDHGFGLKNYMYVVENVKDETVKDIYRSIGPFDHFEHRNVDDDDLDTQRFLRLDFDKRKSGALYRGQVSIETTKPDGMGFKVYPNNSIFEGLFDEGMINGWGRGITSRGELYQGPFLHDAMHGEGLFQWPDGRLYYGGFQGGKKNGKGTYLWPNGQCYEGEFKNDQCSGPGVLHYPDGKTFTGCWKEEKKHGAGYYSWPNGAKYFVHYSEGKMIGEGHIENSAVSIDQIKNEYISLAKKTSKGLNLLNEMMI
jgi:hypothetical protein